MQKQELTPTFFLRHSSRTYHENLIDNPFYQISNELASRIELTARRVRLTGTQIIDVALRFVLDHCEDLLNDQKLVETTFDGCVGYIPSLTTMLYHFDSLKECFTSKFVLAGSVDGDSEAVDTETEALKSCLDKLREIMMEVGDE